MGSVRVIRGRCSPWRRSLLESRRPHATCRLDGPLKLIQSWLSATNEDPPTNPERVTPPRSSADAELRGGLDSGTDAEHQAGRLRWRQIHGKGQAVAREPTDGDDHGAR